MGNTNKVAISGNLTRDAEVTATKDGKEIARFSVAVNDRVRNGDEWEDYANYIDCKMFNAGKVAPYLNKGTKVAIGGKLRHERWERDGKKGSKVVVYVDSLDLMGTPKQEQLYASDIPF